MSKQKLADFLDVPVEQFEPNEDRSTTVVADRLDDTESVADMAYVNSEIALALLEL